MDDYKSLLFACLAIGVYTYAVRWYTDPVSLAPPPYRPMNAER